MSLAANKNNMVYDYTNYNSDESIMNTYNRKNVNFIKGKGVWLFDDKFDKYLDFVSGIAVNTLGHSNPLVVNTIKNQAEKLLHISNLFWNEPQMELASTIKNLTGMESVFFCNSGTESVEGAIKIARKYGKTISPQKSRILYLDNSFHGRSIGALSLNGQAKYRDSFEPLMQNTELVKCNNIGDLVEKFDDNVCAIIVEPIQGEGGIVELTSEFINEIKAQCTSYDALLIYDEIQSGIGRTAKMFAYEYLDVEPDILCVAKGLGAGVPIGAIVVNKKANTLVPGDHGSTFGGNPLVCSVGFEVLNHLSSPGFLDRVQKKGSYLKQKLELLMTDYPLIKEVRGKGLFLGIQLESEPKALLEKCFENKLLLVGAGNNVVRILPPLNVTYDEIDTFLAILRKSLEEIS